MLGISGADLFFDGDAGIIPDLLLQTSECIEQRALTAIGISDERVNRVAGGGSRVAGDMRGQQHFRVPDQQGCGLLPFCG